MIDARALRPHPSMSACRDCVFTTRITRWLAGALNSPHASLRWIRRYLSFVPSADDREFGNALSKKMDFAAECGGSSDVERVNSAIDNMLRKNGQDVRPGDPPGDS